MRWWRVVAVMLVSFVMAQLLGTVPASAASASGPGTGTVTVFIGPGPGAPPNAVDHAVDSGRYLLGGVLGDGTLHDATFIVLQGRKVSFSGTSTFTRSDGATLSGTITGGGPVDASHASGTIDLSSGTRGLASASAHLAFSVKNTNWHSTSRGNAADERFTFSATVTGGAPAAPPRFAVQFAGIQYDSPGADTRTNASLNAEYVTVMNYGATTKNLAGFTVRDGQKHVFSFPNHFILPSGASVRIHTGKGTDNATDLYWDRKSYIWGNTNDTAILRYSSSTPDICTWTKPAAGYKICLT